MLLAVVTVTVQFVLVVLVVDAPVVSAPLVVLVVGAPGGLCGFPCHVKAARFI